MIINHNMNAMNAHRLMTGNTSQAGRSMEKLSSGLRINRAGDDAAGLAISEKMRAQIKGLDQASRNSQDGISMIQTAEGALNETHSILQRMRELATQASNDTNVSVDRGEIQKEMNQLSSEINRIGNTTEFNTQKVLQGDGKVSAAKIGFTDVTLTGGSITNVNAAQVTSLTGSGVAGNNLVFTLNGQQLQVNLKAADTNAQANVTGYNITAGTADVNIGSGAASGVSAGLAGGIKDALEKMIAANDTLRGNYSVTVVSDKITITAQNSLAGTAGNIASISGTMLASISGNAAAVGTQTSVFASGSMTMSAGSLVIGKGMTINGKTIEFYDGGTAAYTGNAIGIDVRGSSTAQNVVSAIIDQAHIAGIGLASGSAAGKLEVLATTAGTDGNNIKVEDGGIQKQFKATFQVGANQGQGFTMEINDMRALALKLTGTAGSADANGAKFTTSNTVTNGTDSITREASLDVSSFSNATNAIKTINNAIESVSAERSKLGAYQNRLEHTINNLGTSSENLSSAESRVRDVDMAKEMMTYSKNNILSQASQAMLAQAKSQPEQVLQLLR